MRSWWLNLALFVATAVSVFTVYAAFWEDPASPDRVQHSALFTFSVLLILGAHEMGHWAMAKAHRVETTLPYFIPVPLGFGTLGAVIRLRGRVPSSNALVDIGAAGPLAGLLIAGPLAWVGLQLSHVGPVPMSAAPEGLFPKMSLVSLVEAGVRWARGLAPDDSFGGVQVFGDNALILLLERLRFGPIAPGHDVFVQQNPVFIAAWFGFLVTMMNLMPVGQLDGGHLTHAWFGERAVTVGRVMVVGLGLLAVFCSVSWLMWLVVVTKVVGLRHPPVTNEAQPLSLGRKVVCSVSFGLAALVFMPVPLGIA